MNARFRIPVIALLIALGVVLAACSGESAETTTTTEATTTTVDATADQPLVLGRGEVPATVPSDFPIPDQAVIGATLIDRPRGLTEVVITFPAQVEEVAAYYETNLETLGYTVVTSEGNDANHLLKWERDTMTGEIIVEVGGSGLSQGVLRFVESVEG